MRMEIYADVVFLINFVMDFFIFWIVSKLIKRKIKWYRLVCGGFVAALFYCLFTFIPALRVYLNIFSAVLILMLGILIAFEPKTLKEFLRLLFISHIAAFAVGGAGTALFYFTNISSHIGNFMRFTVNNFSLKILIAAAALSYIAIKLMQGWISRTFIKKQTFVGITICFDEHKIFLDALVDTGNSLHDPITDYPVIIAEFDGIKNCLPDNVKLIFYENNQTDFQKIMAALKDSRLAGRFRLIPFSSIGKEKGMLFSFRPDMVLVSEAGGERMKKDIIIGIHNLKLSKDGAYKAIISPEILT